MNYKAAWLDWVMLTRQQSSEFYEMMFSCRRSSFRPENYPREDGSLLKPIPLEIFSTTNPFGIGHTWVQYGLSHAQVDYTRIDTERVKTKAEEKATGARPYVTMLNPRQVIGWNSKMVDGKVVLTELRIKEVVVEDGDDYGQTKIKQIRYLTPGKAEIYCKAKDANGATNWALFEEWQTSRQDITLVTLFTKRTGFMCGSPPLLNMTLLNSKH